MGHRPWCGYSKHLIRRRIGIHPRPFIAHILILLAILQQCSSSSTTLSTAGFISATFQTSSQPKESTNARVRLAVSSSSTTIATVATSTTTIPVFPTRQRIAIVGAGAVGSYYGARLAESGVHDVHFYMRSPHYEMAKVNGLQIKSVHGNIHIGPSIIQVYPTTQSMAQMVMNKCNDTNVDNASCGFDWVLVALKSTSLGVIPELVQPLLSPKTRILVIMNGMIENDLLSLWRTKIPKHTSLEESCQAIYGGMALICCNRVAPAVTDHTYYGLLTAGVAWYTNTTTLSTTSVQNEHKDIHQQAFLNLFASTKVDVQYESCLMRGRWRKMMWNLPFNGISVAMGGITVDQIVQDKGLRQLAYDIMDEIILVANREMEERYGPNNFMALGVLDRYAMMKHSDEMGVYKTSTMLDFVNRRGMEVRYIFRVPLERAAALGVATPHLSTVVRQIEAYQRMYNLF